MVGMGEVNANLYNLIPSVFCLLAVTLLGVCKNLDSNPNPNSTHSLDTSNPYDSLSLAISNLNQPLLFVSPCSNPQLRARDSLAPSLTASTTAKPSFDQHPPITKPNIFIPIPTLLFPSFSHSIKHFILIMSKLVNRNPNGSSLKSPPIVNFHNLSINTSPSTDLSISTVTGSGSNISTSSKASDSGFEEKDMLFLSVESVDCVESEKSSLSSSSCCYSVDPNEGSFRTFCPSKPHKSNDVRWDAIQSVKGKDGELGLGHFRLLKKLGFGDIGSVYLAELRGIGCLFAMKVMDKGMLAGRKKLLRAQTEREILGLLDHPFLPTLYSHFETEKFSCLLMEFCSGGDLHLLRQRQPGKHFSEQAARFYVSEVLLALEYLHMMGVVYRDLKPENVLVREDGHIMLSDFDLSLRCFVSPTLVKSSSEPSCTITSYCIQPSCIDPACRLPVCVEPSCFQPTCFKPRLFNSKTSKVKSERTNLASPNSLPVLIAEPTAAKSMSFVGTHEYLAPEIIRGDGHGSAVDWWTFGIFLYELLHGKTPFKGNGNRETLFNVVGQSLKFPEGSTISFAAKDLIRSLLIKDPQKRLGYKRGATEIKQHPFFQNINWALIRSTHPPEIPKPVDLAVFNQALKSSLPPSDKNACDSDRSSSSPYLDFEFF